MSELPRGYRVRAPSPEDAHVVNALVCACDIAESGMPDSSEADLVSDWAQPRVDLARDAWLVEREGGPLVGYAYLWDRADHADFDGDVYVAPGEDLRGLGAYLLERLESRAREQATLAPAGVEPRVVLTALVGREVYRSLVEGAGFRAARLFYRMTIDLEQDTPEPVWPDGVTLSTVADGVDPRAVHELIEHAFESHFMHVPLGYDEWKVRFQDHPDYDPALWLAALHGDELVGASMAYDHGDTGFVRELGVRRAWRGKGVGLGLLQQSFRALRRRGQKRCDLGVDSENATGALRLYERAGMRTRCEIMLYEKRLPPAGGL